ncbi:MAG: hypothetical protein IKR69_05915 [Bacteroidales bacterium]|nr:hypothetical protein [Bacteroidales bacterium]
MDRRLFILFALFFLCFGCGKKEFVPQTEESGEPRTVTISLSSKSMMDQDDSYDGYAFHNVLVIIADPSKGNMVVASKFVDEVPDGAGGHEHWDEKEVVFERIQIGAYKVYAYANIDHTAAQLPGQYIEDIEGALDVGDILPTDRQAATFSGTDVPGPPRFDGEKRRGTSGILMTGFADLDVGVTHSSASVQLLRMVTRLNVYVNNHGDYPLQLNRLWFSDFNASATYLLDHRSGAFPGIPTGNVYRAVPAFDSSELVEGVARGPIVIDPNGRDSLVYSANIYENARTLDGSGNPFEYRIFGEATMNGVTKTIHLKNCELLTYAQVNGMSVNAVRPVMLVCPKTSNGKLFRKDLTKGATFKGGNKEFVTNFVKTYTDDEAYIFYLKKTAASTYSFYSDAACTNLITISKIDSFTLSRGTFVTGSEATSIGFANTDLCNFTSPGGKLLYNNNGILAVTTSPSQKEYQFAVYNPLVEEGSLLQIVDNETAQVSVLRNMLRNQELNIIVNVYYNAQEFSFNFYVENAYWEPGHTMTHIFK